jgi:hypothetical protein
VTAEWGQRRAAYDAQFKLCFGRGGKEYGSHKKKWNFGRKELLPVNHTRIF